MSSKCFIQDLEQIINHPAVNFVIRALESALENWLKTEGNNSYI
ncbi:MAG: hypothetical protein ACFB02_19470 [Mastigocoleus sp.]